MTAADQRHLANRSTAAKDGATKRDPASAPTKKVRDAVDHVIERREKALRDLE